MNTSETYAILAVSGCCPPIKGEFHTYVTPWASLSAVIEEWAEKLPLGETHGLTITIRQWTRDEYAEYCERNDIDTGN